MKFCRIILSKVIMVLLACLVVILCFGDSVLFRMFLAYIYEPNYHNIALGQGQTISIKVRNPNPIKLGYKIMLRLQPIDSQTKNYDQNMSKDELYKLHQQRPEKANEIRELKDGMSYPITLKVIGYKINDDNKDDQPFYFRYVNSDYDEIFSNIAYISDLPMGAYHFEIKDVSEKSDVFDEVEAAVEIHRDFDFK